jgi:ATP-dependent Zn protease
MIDSGLTGLGIVDRRMVTKEELMKENAEILQQLTERTHVLLQKYRDVFEQSLDILIREEVLTGDEFRILMATIQEKTSA